MEAAIRAVVEGALGEYVSLAGCDVSTLPLLLWDLRLKPKSVQEACGADFPFDLTSGQIGALKVEPGCRGTVDVSITNVVLSFAFSPRRALSEMLARKSPEDTSDEPTQPMQILARPPPRFCILHDSTEKRHKVDARFLSCHTCGARLQTNYSQFSLCPVCSEKEARCLICGGWAPERGSYIPPDAPPACDEEPKKVHNAGPRLAVLPTSKRLPPRMASPRPSAIYDSPLLVSSASVVEPPSFSPGSRGSSWSSGGDSRGSSGGSGGDSRGGRLRNAGQARPPGGSPPRQPKSSAVPPRHRPRPPVAGGSARRSRWSEPGQGRRSVQKEQWRRLRECQSSGSRLRGQVEGSAALLPLRGGSVEKTWTLSVREWIESASCMTGGNMGLRKENSSSATSRISGRYSH